MNFKSTYIRAMEWADTVECKHELDHETLRVIDVFGCVLIKLGLIRHVT